LFDSKKKEIKFVNFFLFYFKKENMSCGFGSCGLGGFGGFGGCGFGAGCGFGGYGYGCGYGNSCGYGVGACVNNGSFNGAACGLFGGCGYPGGYGGYGGCGTAYGGYGYGFGCGYGLGIGLNYPLYACSQPCFNNSYPGWGCGGCYNYTNISVPYFGGCSFSPLWSNSLCSSYTPSNLNIKRRRRCDF
jgi:hypothetical protein